jgi:hypothetical protein
MNWTDILGNVASGGVLGLLGNAVSFGLSYFKAKQEHQQAMDRAESDRKTLQLQGELAAAQTAGEMAVAREKGSADAFTASQSAEASLTGETFRWVNAARALNRPALTWLCIGLTGLVYFHTTEPDVRSYIATNVVVMTVAVVTWWFGQRQLDRSSISFGNRAASGSVRGRIG